MATSNRDTCISSGANFGAVHYRPDSQWHKPLCRCFEPGACLLSPILAFWAGPRSLERIKSGGFGNADKRLSGMDRLIAWVRDMRD